MAQETTARWRLELSRTDVWYASYGSNMLESRFRCYVEGGQAEGMQNRCPGFRRDQNFRNETCWETFPHRLFFGRKETKTWGKGGVAFIDPRSNNQDKTYMRLYKITLEQFNDLLVLENLPSHPMNSPLFNENALASILNRGSFLVDDFKGKSWYRNVVYLGKKEDNIPILTFTCPKKSIDGFKSGTGKTILNPPSEQYAKTLIDALVGGEQLTEEAAKAYIQETATKPLR